MGRCSACDARKAKRSCKMNPPGVCTACCGALRNESDCAGCVFWKPPERDYDHLPRYNSSDMERSSVLAAIALGVEQVLCELDERHGRTFRDRDAIKMLELLIDHFAFGEAVETLVDRVDSRMHPVLPALVEGLARHDSAEAVKVLGALRFVAKRRNIGSRHHLDFLQHFVGDLVR